MQAPLQVQGIIQILYERAVRLFTFLLLWIDWRDGGRRFYFFRLVASFQFAEALLQQRQFFPVRSKT